MTRNEKRKKHFFDPLVTFLGGSLKGKRVLDLGCGAGFWSLCAVENGCDFVLGIEGRRAHLDTARAAFEARHIERTRYRFVQQNVFDFSFGDTGPFDIVLCLGLMYHVSKPVVLIETASKVNTDMLIIDTTLSASPGNVLEIRHENLDEPTSAVDHTMVMYPTKKAVVTITGQFGYSSIILKPEFEDTGGVSDFQCGIRRAFVCSKKRDLSTFAAPVEEME